MSEESVFEHWREKLGIKVGSTKEEGLECFMEWRATQKTCERCDGDAYVSFCPVRLICEEADVAELAKVRGNIATLENTPIFLPSMAVKSTSIRFISTCRGGE
jgi:hypothetical protein